MRRTRGQKRFTISEVAANWHELMLPQRIMRPSVAHVNEQLNQRFAATRHSCTTAPISHTRFYEKALRFVKQEFSWQPMVKIW